MMKHFLALILSLFLTLQIQAQFGLSGYYSRINQQEGVYELDGNTSGITGTGYAVGLDYWFRLKNKRIEFSPELNYAHHDLNIELTNIGSGAIKGDAYSLFLNTNIYPFDFNTDCDCPTFSKQNDTFKKGFFIQLSPQVSYHKSSYEELEQEGITFGASLGIGLDIGINKMFTISPIVRYNYHFGLEMVDWSDDDIPLSVLPSDRGSITAGIRFGLRLDGKRF